jgi:amino acid adenylation domain-containing protein
MSNESSATAAPSSVDAKRAAAARLLRARAARPTEAPASYAQQRMWILDRLETANAAFNIARAFRLRGPLDAPAMQRAAAEMVARHAALRTVFAERSGEPVQVIHPAGGFELPVESLEHLPADERFAHAERLAGAEARAGFDLARGPLFRARLLRLDGDDHVLLITMHHIVSDGWSMGLFFRELVALYTAFAQGQPSPLPAPALQYADYARWQRGQTEALERGVAYWTGRLAGAPALLEMPWDRPRPPVQSFRGATISRPVPPELAEAVQRTARDERATLFMVMLAAWQLLLSRHNGQQTVVVGSPVAGRNRTELEGLIGCFLNLLPLRADVDGDFTFRELLARVRESTLEAFQHQEVPFERIVEALGVDRILSHSPVFQAGFVVENAPAGSNGIPGLTVQPLGQSSGTAKLDLRLAVTEGAASLHLSLTYASDLFDAGTAERLLDRYLRVLQQATAHPERRLSALEWMGADERTQLQGMMDGGAADFPRGLCLHQLFADRAARMPDAVALVHAGETVTFAELDARANRLAHYLVARGVRPESRVGICLPRGIDLVVGILGVLKAGGAYIPLDPGYPAERLSYMLADSGAGIVLTASNVADRVADSAAEVVRVDEIRAELASYLSDAPVTAVDPSNLAYVVYTSGSTGKPKGVATPHRGVISYMMHLQRDYGISVDDTIVPLAALSFDASVRELLGSLCAGAHIVFADEDERMDPPRLLARLRNEPVTAVMAIVPSLLRALVDAAEGEGSTVDTLRLILASGEALPGELARRALAVFPNAKLVNQWGATEATLSMTRYFAPKDAGEETLSLGGPIANMRAYVLDDALRAVPVGVAGEAYLGGVGITRGYVDQPALTAERFLPDSFSTEPGARMYRNGDRVRWRHDGTLEFLGRTDHQIKIRGVRIEPAEVEAALLAHDSVREAIVVAREDGGEKRLVAYVTAAAGATASPTELRASLEARLPAFMVPSAVVVLDAMPLSPNGKIDRRQLPAPEFTAQEETYVAPSTPAEEVIAGIWAEVLAAARVGAHDNFFALGGHSLLATRVVSRLRDAFGVEVSLRALFEAPTVAGLAERVEAARRGEGAVSLPAIQPVDRAQPLPLSFAQQRLWFLDRLEPGSTLYSMPRALRLRGTLDAAALERALAEIVRRHEVLRTTYEERDGAPVQVVHAAADFILPIEDFSALPAEDREAAYRERAASEARAPFDLSRGPLFRASLLRLADDDHVLLFSTHHIAGDGWSMGVFSRDLSALYTAFIDGRPSPLAELPVQYADYAAWQREHLAGETLDAEVGWWKQRLAGAPALLELPTDRPRPVEQSYRGGRASVLLPQELSDALKALARREGATPFMVVLAAFQLLLSRYSGQRDVVVGTPIAGRTRREVEGLVGCFVNTLALRADLSGDPAFRELLARVRRTTLEAYEHQDVPFEKLVEELAPERTLAHHPLFQVALTMQNAAGSVLRLPGLQLEVAGVNRQMSKFDLELHWFDKPDGVHASLEYAADLFDAATAERMLAHLQNLVRAVAADPGRRLSRLPLMDDGERRALLHDWNDAAVELPRGVSVQELFEAQVARTPHALAVRCGEERLTYDQLNRAANQLARTLTREGVGPEVVVPILAERGMGYWLGVLSVLKAGGAFLPLDPHHPPARWRQVLEQSRASIVLVQDGMECALRDGTHEMGGAQPRILALEFLAARPQDDGNVPVRIQPKNLAYLIFTSGSTGRPKGAMLEHGGMFNHLHAKNIDLGITSADVVGQNASQCFDISVWQFLSPLLAGATVQIIPDAVATDAAMLVDTLESARVTVLQTVPSLMQLMVEELGRERPEPVRLEALRSLIPNGEVLPPELARTWLRMYPHAVITNAYGATETSDDVTHRRVPVPPADDVRQIGIGGHLANARLYILDRHLEPVPTGVPGELYVGGIQVGRGYTFDPRRTASAFIPDPFTDQAGARLYKTGDRVRLRRDGELEFLGRVDHQVKLRGLRIELGEIEAVLRGVDSVRESVVLVRDDALVGYVVPADLSIGISLPELRRELKEKLPEYMVPAAFVVLDEMPLNANGKADRHALPAPERGDDAESRVAPRTPTEEVLAAVWAELLGVARVGAEDDFFALGGHSLLAMRVVARVRDVFRAELSLRALFEAPTLAAVAARIDAGRRGTDAAPPPPIERVERDGPLPLSFAQQRLWFLDRLEPGSAAYVIPSAQRLAGALDVPALERALGELIRRHEVLRTVYEEQDGEPVQVIRPAAPFVLEMDDLSALSEGEREDEVRARAYANAHEPFDLAAGPPFRARLLRLAPESHVLLLAMHHVAGDGWSLGIVSRELGALYAAFAAGAPDPLPALPLQYADYAAWQRAHLDGPAMERQLAFWRTQLAGAPALLELPTDHPRPAVQGDRGARRSLRLSAELRERLWALARAEGATPFMVMLAAFQALLARHSGQDDVVVGSPIAGRTRAEVEGLVGCFLNTLALRADLSADPDFRGLLAQVRERTLGAYEHQDVPFEKLVEELGTERSLAHSPLFQAMLVFQNVPRAQAPASGLRGSAVGQAKHTAKYDLTLHVVEDADGGVYLELAYRTDLFVADTATRMLEQLRALLEQAAADPSRPLSALDIASDADRGLLAAWNRTERAFELDQCVHQLFEAQAARTPHAVAATHEGRRMTFAELDAGANRLAHWLRRRGVGPESRVGVYLERGLELPLSLLGVMKAGGAYVPLDPSYPADRLAHMLADSGAGLVLTHSRIAEGLAGAPVAVVRLDEAAAEIAAEASTVPDSGVCPANLAYVIYTSGSTGTPKGVMVPHRGVINNLLFPIDNYGLGAGDSVLQLPSVSFDPSVRDLLGTLCAGARLALLPRAAVGDPAQILAAAVAERVSCILAIVPSLLEAVVAEAEARGTVLDSLRLLLISGEALPLQTVRRARAVFPNARVCSQYGPTEGTVISAWHPLDPPQEAGIAPLGGPLPNVRFHVLDAGMRPTAVGVPGELYLGGVGITRGYAGKPGLTAERFLPDPFSPTPGARLYRSGDRVRWRGEGVLEFRGRVDHQVKLRGFRIEPGEIEAALRAHPTVRDAAVLLRGEGVQARLVAYVTPAEGAAPAPRALAAHLDGRLPAYMVPSAIVVMEAFPRTPNGKLDRSRLPAPEYAGDDHVEPRTDAERDVARVWAELLPVEKVGATDHFFALGGHSLIATRVVSRLRALRGVELPLRTLFEAPTVEALAARLEAAEADAPATLDLGPLGTDALAGAIDELSEEELDRLLGSLSGD